MERRHGIVIRDELPPEVTDVPNYPKLVSEAVIDCMVRMHAIDISGQGLAALGKPEGCIERQVRGWADRWSRAKTEEMPAMDRVIQWLADRLPVSPAPTLVHNDYKLDNLMLRLGAIDQVEAVLDWEMTTVGDPLADVGLTLCYWTWATAPQVRARPISAITSEPGGDSREQFIQRYAESTV